jgi:hypothetical protein
MIIAAICTGPNEPDDDDAPDDAPSESCGEVIALEDDFDGGDFADFWFVSSRADSASYVFDGSSVTVEQGSITNTAAQLGLAAACPGSQGASYNFSGPLDLTLDFACAVPVESCQVDVQIFDEASATDGFRVWAELQTDASGTTTYGVFGIWDFGLGGTVESDEPAFSWDTDSRFHVVYDPATAVVEVITTDANGETQVLTHTGSMGLDQYVVTVNTSGFAYAIGEPTARISSLITNLTLE